MRRERPDIILLDVMMPVMDGFEVCRRLKSNPRTHHVPVLMITALDQPSDRVKGLEAGADDFLTKPVDDMQLMARVKSLVRLKSLTDELRAVPRPASRSPLKIPCGMDKINTAAGSILIVDSDQRALVPWLPLDSVPGAAANEVKQPGSSR